MNIGLVGNRYPAITGIDNYVLSLAEGLAALGNTVHVFVRTIAQPPVAVSPRIHVHLVKPIKLLPYSGRRFYFSLLGQFLYVVEYALSVAQSIRTICRSEQLEVVEAPDCAAPGYFIPLLTRVPLIVRLHLALSLGYLLDRNPITPSLRLISAFEKAAIHRARVLTAPSHSVVELTSQTWPLDHSKVRIIEHPVAPQLLNARRLMEHEYSQTILFVGSLSYVKGADILIEAIPMVLAQIPDAKFVFLGGVPQSSAPDSPFYRHLAERVRTLGIVKHVTFLGRVERPEVIRWYQRAAICTVPSRYESASLVCAEAMAAGIPLVASNAGAIPELVQHRQNGLLVQPGCPSELADAILELLCKPSLALSLANNAREMISRRCHPNKIAEQTLHVYRAVVNAL